MSPRTLATALSHCLEPSEGFGETMKKPRSSVQSNKEEASSEQEPKTNGIKADSDGIGTDGTDEKTDGEKKAKRILLVDDNQVNLKVSNFPIAILFVSHRYRLSKCRSKPPDLRTTLPRTG
jgi:hypothetical protein